MNWWRQLAGSLLLLILAGGVASQRNYAAHSVLASGNWYKFSTGRPGVYRIDLAFLSGMGINTSNLASSSVRIYGNGGRPLAEANNGPWMDDLLENAIMVVDGGDGQLNGSDYILFYSPGPDDWEKDSLQQSFRHKKNIYSDRSFYFLSVGGNGKRINTGPLLSSPSVTINSFSERYFHELDTVNFLASGKEWYGEELSDLPGRSLSRSFAVNFPNAVSATPLRIRFNAAARSVGNGSRLDLTVNNQPLAQVSINAVSGGLYDLFAQQVTAEFAAGNAGVNNLVNFRFTPGSFNAQGWINWFELFGRRNISLNGIDQLLFRDWQSVGNARGEFVLGSANSNSQVWEITDPLEPVKMNGTFSNNEFHFVNDCSRLREYVAFNNNNFFQPLPLGKIANQDLHNNSAVELLIVAHPSLVPEAIRLMNFHQQGGTLSKLAGTEEIFNEFSSGSPDPSAIRNFAKMYWDRYRNATIKPKYLLLFGDASFDPLDRIKNNTNLVPAFENDNSLDPLTTYTSDDFFGFLDDNEDINSITVMNLLDLGIGRIPAKNITEAKNFVDKIIDYHSPASLGPWRNDLSFIADDEDNNLHFQDAETITATANAVAPVFNLKKFYLDAYRQETGAGGSKYPEANQAINSQAYNGNLIWNYNGHGGPARLAEENVLDGSILNSWNNTHRLPLFITATCDFAPYDDPLMNSLGENVLLRPGTGAIGLMTTTRPVFAFSNRIMNNNYLQTALQRDVNGNYRSLGDAIKDAKNFTYQSSPDIVNNRKFTLLGDPAMQLAFPKLKVVATSVNGIASSQADTLSATEKITIEGEVRDQQDNILPNFNGNVYPVLYDKFQILSTLGNDPSSQAATFQSRSNVLFRGKASVVNGRFRFSFIMPRDINYQYGNGKLSLYAEDSLRDGNGLFTNLVIGGAAIDNSGDRAGPSIKAYLNDERFVNGGITNQHPVLILKLADSSGINTSSGSVDHDIVATLDNDNRNFFILNDHYQGELNSYQKGTVRFQMPELETGPHTLKIKAWDVLNNSNESILEFTVAKDEELTLEHILNYPNPFTTNTSFWFEHNKPGQLLQVSIEVMTISGRTVKTISRQIITDGNRSNEIEWDGRDERGDKLGRGVYLYKLRVSAANYPAKQKIGKLVIL